MRKGLAVRTAFALMCLGLVLGSGGCFLFINNWTESGGLVGFSRLGGAFGTRTMSRYSPPSLEKALAAKSPSWANQYLAFTADENLTEPASGEIRLARDLRAPFRAELTAGAFDPAKAAALQGGAIGIGVERKDADPPEFYRMDAVFTGTGIDVRGRSHAGFAGPAVSLEWAEVVDFAIEHDGTDLILSARAEWEGLFREVARFPLPGLAEPLRPFVTIDGIGSGGEVGFDDPVLIENAPPPGGLAGEAGVVDLIFQAAELQARALGGLEQVWPDPQAAGWIDDSRSRLDQARTILEEMIATAETKPERKVPKKARKQVKRAAKKAANALKKLEKGRPAKRVTKQIEKATKAEFKALIALGD